MDGMSRNGMGMGMDLSGLAPLCGREEFDQLMAELVADCAPRVFAVTHEYGDRLDGVIAGWEMAFQGYAEFVSASGGFRARLTGPERALRVVRGGAGVVPRLLWAPPGQ